MYKERFIKAFKVAVITMLVMAIALLVLMKWKSDLILDKVMDAVQDQLADSLQYRDATMDWFAYFPSTSIHISDLKLGRHNRPLLSGGELDIVIRILPLLKDKIIIKRLQVLNSILNITYDDGRWSYDVFKKTDTPNASDDAFQTSIEQLSIENTNIQYDDGKSLRFNMAIRDATLKGRFENKNLAAQIEMIGSISDLNTSGYKQTEPFEFTMDGIYQFDMESGLQQFKEWDIRHEGIELSGGGTILREPEYEIVNMDVAWKKADPEWLKKYLPSDLLKTWSAYSFLGESEGQAHIEGKSSTRETPRVTCSASLKNGGIDFHSESEALKGLQVDLKYDSGDEKTKQSSMLDIRFEKNSVLGPSLEGNVHLKNLKNPFIDLYVKGSLPATLLNLMVPASIHFTKGDFEIDQFNMKDYRAEKTSFFSWFEKSNISFSAKDLYFMYIKNKAVVSQGDFRLENGKLTFAVDRFDWNLASGTEVSGVMESKEKQFHYDLKGNLSEGQLVSEGSLSGMEQSPVWNARWKVSSIEMEKLLASFSNFDQTFITSENLSGKANIWAESTIPFDTKGTMLTKQALVRSAIEIQDGRLKNMKTLEDFSTYVHLDDLKDIRFSQMRNYMKIEDGKVYLPVMFIQSSALNMSVSGIHSFDHTILYNLKLNAGQAAANKLKKADVKKDFKPAKKSGWINLYFVLEGTSSDVKYRQDRITVISGFEQSAVLKESLRNHLVEKFGYDVYWLEPNEWEDIPEYR